MPNMLIVDDAHSFSNVGDGTGVAGVVCIEGEVLRYKAIQGTSILLIDGPGSGHAKGALVYDGRGRKISDYRIQGATGNAYHPYASIYEIKCAGAITPAAVADIKKMGYASIINLREASEPGAEEGNYRFWNCGDPSTSAARSSARAAVLK